MPENIQHHGILGMKWGVRRYQKKDGTLTLAGQRRYGEENARTLKKGTEIQNISRRQLDPSHAKARRVYGAYTEADKAEYIDMMANFEYNERGYKNTFTITDDLKIASGRDVVKTIGELAKENPEELAKVFSKAYEAVNLPLFSKSEKYFAKKLSVIQNDPESKKALNVGKQFIQTLPMTSKADNVMNKFYAAMTKKGFDAVLDSNDAYNWTGASQDPLIIFNTSKLGNMTSIKLTKKDLDLAADYVNSKEFRERKKDVSGMVHSSSLFHHGILGMKWGVRRSQEKLDRLSGRAKQEQAKRTEIRKTKGIGSQPYAKISKNLNLTRAKLDLQKAKNEGDATGKILAKNRIKDAKSVKKHGAAGRVSSEMKRIFGSTLTSRELEAIAVNEWRTEIGRQKTKKILRTIGTVAVPLLSAAAIAEGKYYVANGSFGIPSVGFNNGQFEVKVK